MTQKILLFIHILVITLCMRHCECAVKFSLVGKITRTGTIKMCVCVCVGGGGGGVGVVDGWGALRNLSQNNFKGSRDRLWQKLFLGGVDLEGLTTPAPHENFNRAQECCECIIMIAE